jgi:hypothetical protein
MEVEASLILKDISTDPPNTIYVVNTAKIVSNPSKYNIVYLSQLQMDLLD